MRPIDVCTTLLVTSGNRALREPARVRWDGIEELMNIGLRPASRFHSRVTMVDVRGERRSFQEWLDARASSEARLWFAPGPWEESPGADLEELPAHIREAFEGGGGLGLLLLTNGQRVERFMPRVVQPNLYDISGAQLHAFIQGRRKGPELEAAFTRELGPELEGRPLRVFLESRSLEEMQGLISRFMELGVNVEHAEFGGELTEADQEENEKWNAFFMPAPGAGSLSFEYVSAGSGREASAERDVRGGRAALASTLEAVREFADRQALEVWSKHFRRALLRLSLEPQPLDDLTELLLLNGLPTPAVQLASAAMASDVFGGMGSWNDLAFDGPEAETYQRLSDRLLQAMRSGFRAGINSSAT